MTESTDRPDRDGVLVKALGCNLYNFDGAEFVECKHAVWNEILERLGVPSPTRDGAEGAGKLVPPVCCYCDADLSCEKCGVEQPADYPAPPKPAPMSWPQDAPPLHPELFGPDGMRQVSEADLDRAFSVNQPASDAMCAFQMFMAQLIVHEDRLDKDGERTSGNVIVVEQPIPASVYDNALAAANSAPVPSPDGRFDRLTNDEAAHIPEGAVLHVSDKTTRELIGERLSPSPAVAAEPATMLEEAMWMLQDVPGQTLIERIARLTKWYQDLRVSPPVRGDREIIKRVFKEHIRLVRVDPDDPETLWMVKPESLETFLDALPVQSDTTGFNAAIEACARHAETRYPPGVNDQLAAAFRAMKRDVQSGAGERERKRCPRCLGHGIVPVLPGASLSVKAPDSDGDCSLCDGSGFVS